MGILSRKAMALVMSAALMSGLVASTVSAEASTATPPPATLNIWLLGSKPNGFDQVVAKFEQETKSTLNTNLNVTWVPASTYGAKLQLALTTHQQVDLAFDASWLGMNTLASFGDFVNLASYFNDAKYPGLKSSFSNLLLSHNEVAGADGKPGVYAIPLTQTFTDLPGVVYRLDLAKKYGIGKNGQITTLQQLYQYFNAFKKNNPGAIPFAEDGNGRGAFFVLQQTEAKLPTKTNGLAQISNPQLGSVASNAYIKDGKLMGAYVLGQPRSALANFPKAYNVFDFRPYVQTREWHDNGWTESNPMTRTDSQAVFDAGQAGAHYGTLNDLVKGDPTLTQSIADAKLGFFDPNPWTRSGHPHAITTGFQAWNDLVIPETSKSLDRTLAFLNWLFSTQANNDLFSYGVPGVNWKVVGKSQFSIPKNLPASEQYSFPSYELTWNPSYVRFPVGIPAATVKELKYEYNMSAYTASVNNDPLSGFAFDANASTQLKLAEQNPDLSAYAPGFGSAYEPVAMGIEPNPVGFIQNIWKQADNDAQLQNALTTIHDAALQQIGAFLAHKSK